MDGPHGVGAAPERVDGGACAAPQGAALKRVKMGKNEQRRLRGREKTPNFALAAGPQCVNVRPGRGIISLFAMKKSLLLLLCLLPASLAAQVGEPDGDRRLPAAAADSLATPPAEEVRAFLLRAPGFDATDPFWRDGSSASWWLHEGFNAQFSMSLSVGFGKGALKGVGFGQSAAFAYALPLTDRLSVAAGVYADNWDWGPLRLTEGGVAATVAYRLTDAVSVYAYGTKSFFPRHKFPGGNAFPLFLRPGGDRIGAMLDFKLGHNASIQVSVERSSGSDAY